MEKGASAPFFIFHMQDPSSCGHEIAPGGGR